MYLIALTNLVLSHYKGMAIPNVTTSELLDGLTLLVIRWTEGVSHSLLWNRFKLQYSLMKVCSVLARKNIFDIFLRITRLKMFRH